MIEKDLSLKKVKELNFVKHHDNFCSIIPGMCVDSGISRKWARTILLSNIISRNLRIINSDLFTFKNTESNRKAKEILIDYIKDIKKTYFRKVQFSGNISSDDSVATLLVMDIMHFLANRELNYAKSLTSLFKTRQDFVNSLENLIINFFNLEEI